jgi:hypothetical protein
MLDYVCHALSSFQNDFSRQRTWLTFCAIIFYFMIATEMIGVTSMCRFWFQGESVYRSLIRFF